MDREDKRTETKGLREEKSRKMWFLLNNWFQNLMACSFVLFFFVYLF